MTIKTDKICFVIGIAFGAMLGFVVNVIYMSVKIAYVFALPIIIPVRLIKKKLRKNVSV